MIARKYFLMGAFLLVIIITFNISKVLAFSNEPCSKFNYNYGDCSEPPMSATNGGWTIVLNSITKRGDTDNYDWYYTISNPDGVIAGSNFVAFQYPDCCNSADKIDSSIIEALSTPSIDCFSVTQGEPTIYFGRYDNQSFVCKGTPDNTGHWTIVANTQYKTTGTAIIKLGKYVLDFKVAVPGCPTATMPVEPLAGSRTFSQCTNFGQDTIEPFYIDGLGPFDATADDVSVFLTRNTSNEGCADRVFMCNEHDCPDCTTTDPDVCTNSAKCVEIIPEALPATTVVETALNNTCPDENASVMMGSPYYLYTINSGGVTYQRCLDLATKRYTHLCYCKHTTPCPP